jgi:hypothetical protein
MADSEEKKKSMVERMKAGKAKMKELREKAKAEGKEDPKPRKKRMTKKDKEAKEAIANPLAHPAVNDTVRGIDQATKEGTADKPVDMIPVKTAPIDVPALPADKKKVVKEPLKKPEEADTKGIAPSGKPAKVEVNKEIANENTGNMGISAMFPGQEESIKKLVKENKKLKADVKKPEPSPESITVKKVRQHIPDVKSVEAVGKPFSFSAVKKLLYQ